MASLTIRKLDPEIKEYLRVRAARHGRSMEEEVRQILERAFRSERDPKNAFEALRQPFADLEGVDLEVPKRTAGRASPDL